MKIGLSVSLCIMDMVEGRVNSAEVLKIIGRTRAKPEDIERLIMFYREFYWRKNPDACEALFRTFYTEGRIEQPRLTGGRTPGITNGHWVNDESEITWRNF